MLGFGKPPHEPSAAERAAAAITYPEAVARSVKALDAVLAKAANCPPDARDWTFINDTLDERLKLRPIVPVIPGATS